MKYYDRVCKIDVSPDISIENLKIQFEIKKGITSDKNTCRVNVYNLSENTRNKITGDNDGLVIISAGYKDNLGLIAIGQGNISYVTHEIRRPDIITTIYCKDGFKSVKDNFISLSFAENTRLSSVVDIIINKIGLPAKFINYNKNIIIKEGLSYIGNVTNIMDKLASQYKFDWSIQNGQIQILNNKKKGTGKQVVFLSASSGLIDNPDKVISTKKLNEQLTKHTANEYKVTALLQPQLEVGDLVKIESKTLNGVFIVTELEHIGDTRDNSWYTKMLVNKSE